MTKTIENFLRYVKIDTQSSEESTTTPSTMKQHDLAGLLVSELEAMGATEITYDKEHCYVYATVPASAGYENAPVLGFIAHMDTSPAVTDTNVNPRIVENYDGKDIVLNAAENIVMKVEDFPELLHYMGQDLIVTDGTTLLPTAANARLLAKRPTTAVSTELNNCCKMLLAARGRAKISNLFHSVPWVISIVFFCFIFIVIKPSFYPVYWQTRL